MAIWVRRLGLTEKMMFEKSLDGSGATSFRIFTARGGSKESQAKRFCGERC